MSPSLLVKHMYVCVCVCVMCGSQLAASSLMCLSVFCLSLLIFISFLPQDVHKLLQPCRVVCVHLCKCGHVADMHIHVLAGGVVIISCIVTR